MQQDRVKPVRQRVDEEILCHLEAPRVALLLLLKLDIARLLALVLLCLASRTLALKPLVALPLMLHCRGKRAPTLRAARQQMPSSTQ